MIGDINMKVREIMSEKPEILSPDHTIKQVAEKMLEGDFGFIPIGENDRLIGTITDRDIVIRAVAKALDPNQTPARDIMTDEIRYCFENDDVEKASQIMCDLQIRRLIVLNDKKRIVGVISLGDIALQYPDTTLSGQLIEKISEKK